MSDSIRSITVALERDVTEEEAKQLMSAINNFRLVSDTQANIANAYANEWTSEIRAKRSIVNLLIKVIEEFNK
jgi:predicted Zn-dependent peptidase